MTYEFLISIDKLASHPFFLFVTTAFLAKIWILDKFLPQRIIDKKIDVVNRIVEVKNLMKDVRFYFDRAVQTIKQFPKIQQDNVELSRVVEDATKEIGLIICEIMPKKSNYIDTDIEVYFDNDKEIKKALQEYWDEFEKIYNFIVSGKLFENGKKKFSEIPELNMNNFNKAENHLLTSVKKSRAIYRGLKL